MSENQNQVAVTTPDGREIPGLPKQSATGRLCRQLQARGIPFLQLRSGIILRKHRKDRVPECVGMPHLRVPRFTGRTTVPAQTGNFLGDSPTVIKFFGDGSDEYHLDDLSMDQLPDCVQGLMCDAAELFCTVLTLDEVAQAAEWFARDFAARLTASHKANGKIDFGTWYVIPTGPDVLAAIKAAKTMAAPLAQPQAGNVASFATQPVAPAMVAPAVPETPSTYLGPEHEMDEHELAAYRARTGA